MSSDTVSINIDNLTCPILMGLMEDPVTLPCCGKSVSREPLVNHYDNNGNCPWCRNEMNDPRKFPKNIDLANLIDQVNGLVQPMPVVPIVQIQTEYSAKLYPLRNNFGSGQSIVGKLQITSNKNLSFKSLIIVVVDKSGSMSGNPIKQCQYSLERFLDLTYKHKHLISNVVLYNDKATVTNIDTKNPMTKYESFINGICGNGGTRFSSAFEKIVEILSNYCNDVDVSSATVVFMTDGQDNCSDRKKLVLDLKTDIEKIWHKEYTVHTVGFGHGHDFDFLEGLRKIGSLEGAYKFASPQEDNDSLSSKINSILDVISTSMVIPVQIIGCDLMILSGENSKYWCQLAPYDLIDPRVMTIVVNGEEFLINIQIAEDENDPKILSEWLTHSVDKIIEELTMISNSVPKVETGKLPMLDLDVELHLELLVQRSKGIMSRLLEDSNDIKRLEQVLISVEMIKTGKTLDQMKLNDLKSEGKFKTDVNKLSCNVKSVMKDVEWIPQIRSAGTKTLKLIDKFTVKRFCGDQKDKYFLYVLAYYKTPDAIHWFKNNIDVINGEYDNNGNNPLACCSGIGRFPIVLAILEATNYDQTLICQINKQGYSATDMAILFGHNKTADILLSNGGTINIDPKILFMSCLKLHSDVTRNRKDKKCALIKKSVYYTNTADVMIKHKLIVVTEELFQYTSDSNIVDYLSKKMLTTVSLEVSILKGIYDNVVNELPNIDPTKFTWKPYVDIFQKSSTDHVKIVQLLIESGKANPLEPFRTLVNYEDGTSYDETTWPLFLACKRGQYNMFSALIPYYDTPAKLNFTGGNGNTALWIACAGGYIDIVTELLAYGADPSIQNTKGDSALIPACQKGYITIVELLLNSGASLDAYNINRDNPVLICCRCGQAKILELIFNFVGKDKVAEYLVTFAEIDGFVPLHASTELDKLECIKTCVKFGADLEAKTNDDNKIIAGATALHLACFYGRLHSVMVLVSLGADVKAITNIGGFTPLHIAIMQGHEQVVRYLLTLEKGKECINMLDADNKLPAYYANKIGNDKILDEFFTNKLEKYLLNAMISTPDIEKKCADVLVKYGQSMLSYEYPKITENTDILTQAIINGNKSLVSAILTMDKEMQLITKPDEFGISPIFWLQYTGYDIKQLALPEATIQSIEPLFSNLAKIIAVHPQNKLLCSFQPTSLKMLTNGTVANILEKQNNGFGMNIDCDVIANLKKTSTTNHPLLGFMEKLKNNKVFPDGEMALKYIVMDAKYNIIRRVASGDITISPLCMLAIFLYTSNYEIFKQVNIALKDLTPSNFWFPFVNTLYTAISLLPPFEGEVYRAVNSRFDIGTYEIGKTITWNTFSVCSFESKNSTDMIKKDSRVHGVVFIIQSKTGRKINKYSKYPVDAEVIFLPDSKFIVKSYYAPNVIALAQANIRDSTFRIRDKDIEKAINGEASIIVELMEV